MRDNASVPLAGGVRVDGSSHTNRSQARHTRLGRVWAEVRGFWPFTSTYTPDWDFVFDLVTRTGVEAVFLPTVAAGVWTARAYLRDSVVSAKRRYVPVKSDRIWMCLLGGTGAVVEPGPTAPTRTAGIRTSARPSERVAIRCATSQEAEGGRGNRG